MLSGTASFSFNKTPMCTDQSGLSPTQTGESDLNHLAKHVEQNTTRRGLLCNCMTSLTISIHSTICNLRLRSSTHSGTVP